MRVRNLLFGILPLVMMAAGCGGPRSATPEDQARASIANLLADFENLPANPKEFAAAFAGGTPTAARQKYVGNVYRLVGSPTINGGSATAKVAIQRVSTGQWLGEATWEFTKVGESWKVKSGPLP